MHCRKQFIRLATGDTKELNPININVFPAINLIYFTQSQVTQTIIKNCFIKADFAHHKSDDYAGGEVSDDMKQ